MNNPLLHTNTSNIQLAEKQLKAYMLLVSLIICGLAVATITANKVVHLGVDFPFSNIVFSVFTYPLIDCVCELWGRKIANQTVVFALASQLLVGLLLHLSIIVPAAEFWHFQSEYSKLIATSGSVVVASLIAFYVSQVLDILLFQKIKNVTQGKWLWLRTNVSTVIGQAIDSSIFIAIVFYGYSEKYQILISSIMVKILISILMTPVVYCIVFSINKYLNYNTFAFDARQSP